MRAVYFLPLFPHQGTKLALGLHLYQRKRRVSNPCLQNSWTMNSSGYQLALRLKLRNVNAFVCIVMPCSAISWARVITTNTARLGVWHNVTLDGFSQQTNLPLELWTRVLKEICYRLIQWMLKPCSLKLKTIDKGGKKNQNRQGNYMKEGWFATVTTIKITQTTFTVKSVICYRKIIQIVSDFSLSRRRTCTKSSNRRCRKRQETISC